MATIYNFLKSPRFSRQDLADALNGVADLTPFYCGVSGGSGNAQTLTSNLSLDLTVIRRFFFKAGFSNTGNVTLNLDGTGSLAVVLPDGTQVRPNGITAGRFYEVFYNATNYTLLNVTQEWQPWTISGGTILGGGSFSLAPAGASTAYRFTDDGCIEIRGRVTGTSTGTVTGFYINPPLTNTYATDQSLGGYALVNGTRTGATILLDAGAGGKIYVAKFDNSAWTAGANTGVVFETGTKYRLT